MMGMLDFKSDTSISPSRADGLLSFQHVVKRGYGQFDQDSLFDMATGEAFPCEHVVIAHIFQPRWQKFLPLFTALTSIDDVPNSLMLYRPVAWAFDRGKLCIQVNSVGRMSFHLFDEDLRDINLASKAYALQTVPRLTDEAVEELDLTFGDLDGQEVQFPAGSTMRPSKRLLALHAYGAWLKAWSLYPNIEFPIPRHIFSDDETNGANRPDLGFSIEQWMLSVHASLPVRKSRQSPWDTTLTWHGSLTCNGGLLQGYLLVVANA
jgi:hypothetical protein